MRDFKLRVLPQTQDYVMPFQRLDGFSKIWWNQPTTRVDDNTRTGKAYVQFLVDGVETGRAEIDSWDLSDSYIGVDASVETKQVCFFEIRRDAQGRGYGTEFAQRLVNHYSGEPMIAFSEEADEFWERIGWIYYPRKDRDPTYQKLFASRSLGS